MSRAFVINGDEWGFCKREHRRCSSAADDGECMRSECKLDPWEREYDEPAAKAPGASEKTT